jgi:hypothetical protein
LAFQRAFATILVFVTVFGPGIWAEPLVHTFSIVARDQETGEMGVARLPAAGLFPNDASLIARIRALAPR